ncbi:MAG: Phosphatidate cytidylyltransferase [Synergistetes bacterium ADurb.Bin155]|jgi:phosphatidate cytidylyltransferase|nr:phosphatidate cytidylyltransferase [Synergistales bacterium]MBP8995138.1 phosphatidate cytidylyltransferase [Synergistales bacterium]NMD17711.1 phosphatidate cytidylyltransferase [Synergistaceae bacterium]OQB47350.1 MAG: Phosphatidate cytidylyltransferase [Synergistetes bacterium ADurb.Bin155]HQL02214.1 phosphatidate cytidylyltransferase [Synergistales bacterium]
MERVNLFQRELIVRSASGLALGLAILGGIYLGNPYWFALCLLICMASLGEYYRMISQKGHVSRVVGFGAGISSLFAAVYSEDPAVLLPLLAAAPMLVLFVELARKHILGESHGITSSGGTAAGILYIVLPWSFMVVLRDHMWGTYLLVTLFACTWSCDVFSYLVGSRWGETPLCPTVSPKKTVEGFLGGLTGSLLCGGCLAYYWGMAPFSIILIALFCGTFGQVGDLAESLLKREAGIKDTGDLIPGHGGMLDRFDSILVNSVLVFFVFGVLW